MGTDRYAYLSRLRRVDPVAKVWVSLAVLLLCLFSESIAVGLVTLAVMSVLNVALGGQRPGTVLRFMKVPLAFLVIGCLTIVVRPIPAEEPALWAVWLFDRFRWGITRTWLHMGLMVFCKAMGAISAMYFLALNTPMTDLILALERLHVPKLLVELMELIYRFIFVLMDTARRIRVAQESRLGYGSFRKSLDHMGDLVSLVFLRAWRKGDKVYTALESRGYDGSLTTLSAAYTGGARVYAWGAAAAALQVVTLLLERRLPL